MDIDYFSGKLTSPTAVAKSATIGAVIGALGVGVANKLGGALAAAGKKSLGDVVGSSAGGVVSAGVASIADQAIEVDSEDGTISLGKVDGVEVYNDVTKGAVGGAIAGKVPTGKMMSGVLGNTATKGRGAAKIAETVVDEVQGVAVDKGLDAIGDDDDD